MDRRDILRIEELAVLGTPNYVHGPMSNGLARIKRCFFLPGWCYSGALEYTCSAFTRRHHVHWNMKEHRIRECVASADSIRNEKGP